MRKRAYTGIEPVTSRTLSENHTTRPAGLKGSDRNRLYNGTIRREQNQYAVIANMESEIVRIVL